MAERRPTSPFFFTALFLVFAALSFFSRLLPLGLTPVSLPMPDLMLGLTFCWVLRRPDYLPAVVIVAVFLTEDLLLSRPPGLWALMVLLGSEFLRVRQSALRELGFPAEFGAVAAVLVGMFFANRLILAIVMSPRPPLGLSFLQIAVTVLSYPPLVMVSHFVFKVRKPAMGEVDALGHKL
jgi:rod shape-determining protein MreD